jgi:hypothetical protein
MTTTERAQRHRQGRGDETEKLETETFRASDDFRDEQQQRMNTQRQQATCRQSIN